MRTKREGTGLDSRRQHDDDVVHRLSVRSTSTGSSLLSDNEPLSSSSQSEPIRHPPLPGFGHNRNISGSGCFGSDGHRSACEFDVGGQFTQSDHSQPELADELTSRGTWQQDSVTDSKEAVDTIKLEDMFHGAPGCVVPQKNVSNDTENNLHVSPEERPLWTELSYGSDKKKNSTTLNAVSLSNNLFSFFRQTQTCLIITVSSIFVIPWFL